MSFLTILLVASAFYFANARPDSPPTSESLGYPVRAKVKVPEDYVSVTDPNDYQHQLHAFMDDMRIAIDKHMTPLMSKLNVKQQDEMKIMGLNGLASCVNYLLLLMQEMENEKSEDVFSQFHDRSFPRHEMILEFSAPQPLSAPFLATLEADDDGEHGAE